MCDMMRECVGNIDWPKDVPSRTADPVTNVFSSLIRGLSDLTQPTEKNNSTPNNQTSAPPTDKPDNQTPQTETSSNNTNQFIELLSNLFGGLLNVGQANNSDGVSTGTLNNNPTPDKSAPTENIPSPAQNQNDSSEVENATHGQLDSNNDKLN